MKRIGLTLALLLCLPSLASAAEPKAVIEAPPRVAPGNVVFLDGSKSASDKPLKWVVVGKPATPFALITFDKDARKNVYALIPNAPEGTHTFALVAVGTTPDGKDVDVAVEVTQVVVGQLAPLPPKPTPGPTPPPTPTPSPVPADATERLGFDYAKSLISAADSAIDAAARGRYDSTQDLAAAQRKAFTDALTVAFGPIATELKKAVGEPSDQPSARDVQAAQDYLKKIQSGVRAAK